MRTLSALLRMMQGCLVTNFCLLLPRVCLCAVAMDGECQRDELMLAGGHRIVTIDGFEDVPPYNEIALKKAVSK